MAESRTGPKFGQPTLFLFLVYFSFTSLILLDLHDAFTTCSMTNTTLGVRMSRKVRGPVKTQSHLEQNLTLLVFRSMQIRAPLVMIYCLPCRSLCLKAKETF